MNPTIMHINFGEITYPSYGKKTVDDICKQAKEIGYDGIEFRGDPPIELQHLSFREYAQQVADGKKKYDLEHILFCIWLSDCANPDKDVRKKCIETAVEKAKIVSDLCGTTVCNTFGALTRSKISTAPPAAYEFHGSAAASQSDWDLTVDAYQQFGKATESLGMKFGFETHMNYIHDLPDATRKLVDLIDCAHIGVNMDYGNMVCFPVRPSVEETIDIFGDKLFYIHLKNSCAVPGSTGRLASYLGDGEINHRLYLQKLKEVGYTGPIGLEAPRDGDRVWFAQRDFEYYKAVVASL